MWFFNREQEHREIHQLELARDWTQRNTPLIRALIEQLTSKVIDLLADDESDISWDLKRKFLKTTPHERPLCHSVVEGIPENILAPGMTKQKSRILYLHTDHMTIGYTHSDITLGDIHIDPTFGQFFPESFDSLQKRHGKLFRNGILVAPEKDIERAFHIVYE